MARRHPKFRNPDDAREQMNLNKADRKVGLVLFRERKSAV
jgi:hypothetical protein